MGLAKLWTLIICSCLTQLAFGQDSIQKTRDSNGGLLLIPWKNGKVNGVQKVYYLDGKLRAEGIFVDGKAEGYSKQYSPNGLLVRVSYFRNNFRHGTDTSFFENGTIRSLFNFVDGKLDGMTKEFDKNGQLSREGLNEKGVPIGILKTYKSGKLFNEKHYTNGKGDWYKEYDDNGKTVKFIEYNEDGKRKK
ncbi:MAG TPA: toxin-antitoxin system YwqK family antitoxin [Bacteroidia bacterium]|jgi:antitoxin component YwqK of YwqJK toxin-antitoxin module|nr:toxin-antitoxin system YwqK family antitoxin [Bacteroidia bacterium]